MIRPGSDRYRKMPTAAQRRAVVRAGHSAREFMGTMAAVAMLRHGMPSVEWCWAWMLVPLRHWDDDTVLAMMAATPETDWWRGV